MHNADPLRIGSAMPGILFVWPTKPVRICARVPQGQEVSALSATRTLDACACAARPEYSGSAARKAYPGGCCDNPAGMKCTGHS